MYIVEVGLLIKLRPVQVSASLRGRSDDAGTGKETVHNIGIELDFPVGCYFFEELSNLQIMVYPMEVVIPDVLQRG